MTDQFCGIANIPERRRVLRKPYRTPVRYALGAEANGLGTVRDISSEGMFMETPHPFEVGDRVDIAFHFRHTKHSLNIEGEITRCAHGGVGIRFLWP